MIWIMIFKVLIIDKMKKIVEIYQSVPVKIFGKYSKKCERFIEFVCPVENIVKNSSASMKNVPGVDQSTMIAQNKE